MINFNSMKNNLTPVSTENQDIRKNSPSNEESAVKDEFVKSNQSGGSGFKLGAKMVSLFTDYALGIRMPSADKKPFDKDQIEEIIGQLQPGDVLISSSDNYPNWKILEKLAIGSDFTHAAIYEGDGKFIEATSPKVIRSDLREDLNFKQQFEVVRPPYKSKEDIKAALDYARAQIGKPYTTEMDFETDKELGCSELVQRSLMAMPNPIEVRTVNIAGMKIVPPDAFNEIEGSKTIFTNRKSFFSMLVGKQYPVMLSAIAAGTLGAVTMGPLGLAAGVIGGTLLSSSIGNKIETGSFRLYV